MWHIVGIGIGAALGYGVAGNRGQHWAVRVLCGVLAVLLLAALVVAGLVGGKDAPESRLWSGMLPAFLLVVVVFGLSWLARGGVAAVPWLKENPGKVAAVVVGLAVAAAAAGWLDVAPEAPEAPAAISMPAPVVEAPTAAPVAQFEQQASCDCASGAVCTGPRGGRYCIRQDGKKQYQ